MNLIIKKENLGHYVEVSMSLPNIYLTNELRNCKEKINLAVITLDETKAEPKTLSLYIGISWEPHTKDLTEGREGCVWCLWWSLQIQGCSQSTCENSVHEGWRETIQLWWLRRKVEDQRKPHCSCFKWRHTKICESMPNRVSDWILPEDTHWNNSYIKKIVRKFEP
jgi:hypothetical protein